VSSNIFVGLAAVIMGTTYSVTTMQLPKAVIGSPLAPMIFPLLLGILMTFCGIFMIGIELLRNKNADQTIDKAKKGGNHFKLIVGTILICIIYSLIFNRVGFIIATVLFLGGLLFFINGFRAWLLNISITLIFSFGIWYLFEKILHITLP